MNSIRLGVPLDGEWSLAQDPEDVGLKDRWFAKAAPPDALTVDVPSVWDIWMPDYDGVGWYFREFEVGNEWQEFHASLECESVDYCAQVWGNWEWLGSDWCG